MAAIALIAALAPLEVLVVVALLAAGAAGRGRWLALLFGPVAVATSTLVVLAAFGDLEKSWPAIVAGAAAGLVVVALVEWVAKRGPARPHLRTATPRRGNEGGS